MTKRWLVKYSGGHWLAMAPDARIFVFHGDREGWHNALTLANMEASYEVMEPTG